MADILDRLKAALADRYTIDRELGSGGMATVYPAEDLKHHRKVAVKPRATRRENLSVSSTGDRWPRPSRLSR